MLPTKAPSLSPTVEPTLAPSRSSAAPTANIAPRVKTTVTFKVTGDITTLGEQEKQQAQEALSNDLAKKLGISSSRILVTLLPGSILVNVVILGDEESAVMAVATQLVQTIQAAAASPSNSSFISSTLFSFESMLKFIDTSYTPSVSKVEITALPSIDDERDEKEEIKGLVGIIVGALVVFIAVVGTVYFVMKRNKTVSVLASREEECAETVKKGAISSNQTVLVIVGKEGGSASSIQDVAGNVSLVPMVVRGSVIGGDANGAVYNLKEK